MGKRLLQQRRGRGSIFKALGHRYKGKSSHPQPSKETITAIVKTIKNCPAHSAPVADIIQENGKQTFMILPEGIREKDKLMIGEEAEIKIGNTTTLNKIPEGTQIYNIELNPGDGGKLVRASGMTARLVTKTGNKATIILPSKKQKILSIGCRATIGTVAGGGRTDKPLMKAGNAFHKNKARRKHYPLVQGISMSAVAHPHGGKKSSQKGRPTQCSRNAPPGRKVGKIAPRRTGRRKR